MDATAIIDPEAENHGPIPALPRRSQPYPGLVVGGWALEEQIDEDAVSLE